MMGSMAAESGDPASTHRGTHEPHPAGVAGEEDSGSVILGHHVGVQHRQQDAPGQTHGNTGTGAGPHPVDGKLHDRPPG
jgi:hypothetical protein